MKKALMIVVITIAAGPLATVSWAGGMGGGGMGGGMSGGMGGGGMSGALSSLWSRLMNSFGGQQMGPGRQGNSRYNPERGQTGHQAQQRGRAAYDRDLHQLNVEIYAKEQSLFKEMQKKSPDRTRMALLHRQVSNLMQRYDEKSQAFENRQRQENHSPNEN